MQAQVLCIFFACISDDVHLCPDLPALLGSRPWRALCEEMLLRSVKTSPNSCMIVSLLSLSHDITSADDDDQVSHMENKEKAIRNAAARAVHRFCSAPTRELYDEGKLVCLIFLSKLIFASVRPFVWTEAMETEWQSSHEIEW